VGAPPPGAGQGSGGGQGGSGSGGSGGPGGGGGGSPAKARKDRFLVPINTDFDLYSMGKDGKSVAALTAAASRDDVVRAANGAFIGLASRF
jgi:general secretion pathway protein G